MNVSNNEYTHVIVGGPELGKQNIKYRRQRLLEYLAAKPETKLVYWIYFNPGSRKLPGTLNKPELPAMYKQQPFNKIRQIEIADFKTLLAFLETGQLLIKKKILDIIQGQEKQILWYTMHHFARMIEFKNWDLVVYDCSDNWSGNYEQDSIIKKIWGAMAERSERHIIQNSDIQFATSMFLKQKLDKLKDSDSYLVEHGYDPALFQENNQISRDDKHKSPRLCFIGTLKEKKIDISLLLQVMKLKKDWELWVLGPVRDESDIKSEYIQLKELTNVKFLESVPTEEVPNILYRVDIGLLPYKNNRFTRGVFPLKFYEYMAADLPIVSCNLSSLSHFEESGVLFGSSGEVQDFIKNCEDALEKGAPSKAYTDILEKSTWEIKFGEMYNHVLAELNSK